MNLQDLIDENGLQQDDWSLTRPVFGEEGQLEVVGWSGYRGSNKLYLVSCSACKQDIELFGSGLFSATKHNLLSGKIPCGCSVATKWQEYQWIIRIKRLCNETGYSLISYGEFGGGKTRGIFSCPIHGELEPKAFKDFYNGGKRCIECRRDLVKESLTLPDEHHISGFMSTGSYPEGSTFVRSARVISHTRYREGLTPYWWFKCGQCGESFERMHGDFKCGKLPCSCGHYRQTIAYIHVVSDGDTDKFLKFGITRPIGSNRLKSIAQGTCYDIRNLGEWSFTECADCKRAEKTVKGQLVCGVVTKNEFKSGWTETTSLSNLEAIIKIFEDCGGIKL